MLMGTCDQIVVTKSEWGISYWQTSTFLLLWFLFFVQHWTLSVGDEGRTEMCRRKEKGWVKAGST